MGPLWLWGPLSIGGIMGCGYAVWCQRKRVGIGCVCCVIALGQAHRAQQAVLPESLLNYPVLIEGNVLSLQVFPAYQRAVVQIHSCHPLASSNASCAMVQRVQLALPSSLTIAEGERWQMSVRLKPPHGMANPYQWDTVWRLRRQGIGGIGSLLTHSSPRRLASAGWQPAAGLHRQIEISPVSAQAKRWLIGMIVGDGSAFDDSDWQLFSDTGIMHLVVVSGSHITLAVGLWLMIGRWGVRLLRPTRYRRMASPRVGAALSGIGYALLAQGGAPAVRACIALLPWVLASKSLWRPSRWQMWWLALASVLLLMPWSLLVPGVWLSFGAVAGLYLMHPHREETPSISRLLYSHGLITLLMEGALLFMMGRWAPLSFFANLVAIPWISLLLMPLGMVGALCAWLWPSAATVCWQLFDMLLTPLCMLLNGAAHLCPSRCIDPHPAAVIGVAMMVCAIVWMLPCCARCWRYGLSLGCLLMVVGRMPTNGPLAGNFELTVLDVGQGQMVELRTHQHRYLFDTGPENHAGRRAIDEIWPGTQLFDGVIVSHADLDHAGGIPSLRQRHRVAQWWAPWALPALTSSVNATGNNAVPAKNSTLAKDSISVEDSASKSSISKESASAKDATLPLSLCRAGMEWTIDDVHFRFLWPQPNRPLASAENDRSCVLLVEGKTGRALLTGDASAQVEQWLLNDIDRPISVWVAGHHGSHSSNSRALLIRARPVVMLYSAGYANPYHHPAQQTVERVQNVGAEQWNTAEVGAITIRFLPSGEVSVDPQRRDQTVVIRRL